MLNLEKCYIPGCISACNIKHLLNLRSVPPHVTQVSQLLSWEIAIINRRTCWYPAQIGGDTRVFSHQLTLAQVESLGEGDEGKGVRECSWCARTTEWTRFCSLSVSPTGFFGTVHQLDPLRERCRLTNDYSCGRRLCARTNVFNNPVTIMSIDELIDKL